MVVSQGDYFRHGAVKTVVQNAELANCWGGGRLAEGEGLALFSDAKTSKYPPQQIIASKFPSNLGQRVLRFPQILG